MHLKTRNNNAYGRNRVNIVDDIVDILVKIINIVADIVNILVDIVNIVSDIVLLILYCSTLLNKLQ